MRAPSVFLSAATDDLETWRNVLDAAFRRSGFQVYTQKKSLGVTGGGVLDLLRQHLDECDYVVHLAGVAFGSEPELPPFPDHPLFRCSYTQFEYYYAHINKKQVLACVCSKAFPYESFVEKGTTDAERQQRIHLQELHRQRVISGKFEDTPFLDLPRTLNESVDNAQEMLQTVAAIVARIARDIPESLSRTETEAVHPLYRVKDELDDLSAKSPEEIQKYLSLYQERAYRHTATILSCCLLFALTVVVVVVWGFRDHNQGNGTGGHSGSVLLNAPGSSDSDSLAGASESDATEILQNCTSSALRRIGNNPLLSDHDRWRFVRLFNFIAQKHGIEGVQPTRELAKSLRGEDPSRTISAAAACDNPLIQSLATEFQAENQILFHIIQDMIKDE